MTEHIKRKDAREAIWRILNGMGYSQKHNDRLVEEVDAVLEDYPAADVRPVARGKWKEDWETGCSECSACGESYLWEDYDGVCEWNFCPNCGADMRPTLMSGANGEGKNENRAD